MNAASLAAVNAIENNFGLNPSYDPEIERKKQEALAKAAEISLEPIEGLVKFRDSCVAKANTEVVEIKHLLEQPGLSALGRQSLMEDLDFALSWRSYAAMIPVTPVAVGIDVATLPLPVGKIAGGIGKGIVQLTKSAAQPTMKAMSRPVVQFFNQGKSFVHSVRIPPLQMHFANAELQAITRLNQAPYNPRVMHTLLQERYGAENISAYTVVPLGKHNAGLGHLGIPHPQTGIPFDGRGFPIFDKHVVYETRVSQKTVQSSKSYIHMKEATFHLKESLIKGEINLSNFNEQQVTAIFAGEKKIPGLTWHHNQELGRMQLIPETIHRETRHIGGMELWGFEK